MNPAAPRPAGQAHTTLPWRVVPATDPGLDWRQCAAISKPGWSEFALVATAIDGRDDPEGHANAALIVTAVNAHADLVAALEAARAYMVNAAIDIETRVPHRTTLETLRGGISKIDAALASAKRGTP